MKMLLSDAIMTGSVFIERFNPGSYCDCAVGMAAASLQGRQLRPNEHPFHVACKEWPILLERVPIPNCLFEKRQFLLLPDYGPTTVENIISCAFVLVCYENMPLEALVDMVREIESQFPQPVEQPTPVFTPKLEPVAVH